MTIWGNLDILRIYTNTEEVDMSTAITFNAAKEAYIRQYGEFFNDNEYESFDDAFRDAWESIDFISGAKYLYEFVEGMTRLPQLTQY